MPEADPRTTLQGYLRDRSHWVFAMDASEQPFATRLLQAANATWAEGAPKIAVDWWCMHMASKDLESGEEHCLGAMLIVCIPKTALSAETLQVLGREAHGVDVPLDVLLQAPIITPIAAPAMWRVGEQMQALRAWLEDDGDVHRIELDEEEEP